MKNLLKTLLCITLINISAYSMNGKSNNDSSNFIRGFVQNNNADKNKDKIDSNEDHLNEADKKNNEFKDKFNINEKDDLSDNDIKYEKNNIINNNEKNSLFWKDNILNNSKNFSSQNIIFNNNKFNIEDYVEDPDSPKNYPSIVFNIHNEQRPDINYKIPLEDIIIKTPYDNENHAGLQNISSICYMNSVLQCLSSLKPIKSDFFVSLDKNKEKIKNVLEWKNANPKKYNCPNLNELFALEFANVILNIKLLNTSAYYAPYDFHGVLKEMNDLLFSSAADAKDFVMHLYQTIHTALNNNGNNEQQYNNNNDSQDNDNDSQYYNEICYKKSTKEYEEQNNSPFSRNFYFYEGTCTKCLNCNQGNSFNIVFFHGSKLSFYFPILETKDFVKKSGDEKQKITLDDCFNFYLKTEKLIIDNRIYCNTCKSLQDAEMNTFIDTLPEVITIILNRGKDNINADILTEIPQHINLEDVVVRKTDKNMNYRLISFVAHTGESGPNGHYIAYTNDSGQQWVKCNDAFIDEVEDDEVNKILNEQANKKQNAYVLFYQRMTDEEVKQVKEKNINIHKVTNEDIRNSVQKVKEITDKSNKQPPRNNKQNNTGNINSIVNNNQMMQHNVGNNITNQTPYYTSNMMMNNNNMMSNNMVHSNNMMQNPMMYTNNMNMMGTHPMMQQYMGNNMMNQNMMMNNNNMISNNMGYSNNMMQNPNPMMYSNNRNMMGTHPMMQQYMGNNMMTQIPYYTSNMMMGNMNNNMNMSNMNMNNNVGMNNTYNSMGMMNQNRMMNNK